MILATFLSVFSKWLSVDFISDLKNHHNNLNEALHHETSTSSASALSSLMRDWFQGTGGNEIYSLGVECEGEIILYWCTQCCKILTINPHPNYKYWNPDSSRSSCRFRTPDSKDVKANS